MRAQFLLTTAIFLGGLLYAPFATAAEDSDVELEESESESEGDEEAEGDTEPEEGDTGTADPEVDKETSPVEDPGKTYLFAGLRYRGIVVPKFMFSAFGADGGSTVYAHSFGPEFAVRKDGFEYQFALTYTGYGMDPTPIKSKSDPVYAFELIESNIKVLYITADFLWSHSFSPKVALNYGVGAGFGLVWGSLIRQQAYPDPNGPGGYSPCPGVVPGDLFCTPDNDHYNGYEEPSWANGGSKPIIMPWLSLQTGLRYKPHRNFVGRLDVGFGIGQFFFGIGADYGL